MNNIILQYFDNINENIILDNAENVLYDYTFGLDVQDIRRKCICRCNNNFNLCNRNIIDNSIYCRYHKNTKIGHIYKIFYYILLIKKLLKLKMIV